MVLHKKNPHYILLIYVCQCSSSNDKPYRIRLHISFKFILKFHLIKVIYICNFFLSKISFLFHKNKWGLRMYLSLFFSRFPENWLTIIWWNKWYKRFLRWCLASINRSSLISLFAYCLLVDSQFFNIHTISTKLKNRPESFILLWWFGSFSLELTNLFICPANNKFIWKKNPCYWYKLFLAFDYFN